MNPVAPVTKARVAIGQGYPPPQHNTLRRLRRVPQRNRDGFVPAQAATARASRCAPTLRLTRCKALSTVLQSHSKRSPTCS